MRLVEVTYDRSAETVIRTLYLDEGKTLAEIADQLSVDMGQPVSHKTIHGWISRWGITRREVIAKPIQAAS